MPAALLHQISGTTSFHPQKRQNFRQPLLEQVLRKLLEQLPAVAHSLFESAEDPAFQPQANSMRSPHSMANHSETP
jgi:hypothetical protein